MNPSGGRWYRASMAVGLALGLATLAAPPWPGHPASASAESGSTNPVDSDGDGVPDMDDLCPGADDTHDASGDGIVIIDDIVFVILSFGTTCGG